MIQRKYTIPKEELAAMIDAGKTNAEIASHFGCAVRTLQARMKKLGLMRWEYYNFDPEELRRLYVDEGLTCQEIADMKGCCRWTIWKHVSKITKTRPNKRIKGKYTGEKHFAWKGGWYIRAGYIATKVDTAKYAPEHRLVMERLIGRPLEDHEVVHHMDGSRDNNDPSNLMLLTGSEHSALHAEMRAVPGLDQREWIMRYRASQSPLPQKNKAA